MPDNNFILASQSKIRAQVLINAGINPLLAPAPIDERGLEATWVKLSAKQVSSRLAKAKALSVSKLHHDSIVIGADQVLEIDGKRLNKAPTIEKVREHLELMRGKTHYLHASTSVAKSGKVIFTTTKSAKMTMFNFSDAFLEKYLSTEGEKVKSSVGCYQYEGAGLQLFEKIDGDFYTIIGIPLLPVFKFLRENGLILK